LITISSEHSVDVHKFKAFCEDTFLLYVNTYPWYPMSPTVHKILIHGWQIINSSLVPVGCLGENASEARNKYYKNDRKSHARKNCRLNNMTDVFYRAMDSSDPLISSICLNERQKKLKKKPLPAEVINLLKCPPPPNYETITSEIENEVLDSGDDSDDYLEIELDDEED